MQAFLDFATSLAQRNCLVGVTCLPGYDRIEPWIKHPNGFTLEETVAACGEGIHALVAQSVVDREDRELTCIFHDWGCAFGSVQINRVLEESDLPFMHPRQVVLFDVAGPPHPSVRANMKNVSRSSFWNNFKRLSYQLFFASCFALQKHASTHIAQAFYKVGSLGLFGILRMTPVGPLDGNLLSKRQSHIPLRKCIWMMYPYYYMVTQGADVFPQFHLPKPDMMRVLYMYGVQKKVMFHTPSTIQYFNEQDGVNNKMIPVENAGHWLYLHEPEYCLKAVLEFCFGSEL